MFLYTKSADNLLNLNHASRLTVIYRGKTAAGRQVWSVVLFMAKSDQYQVLADYDSRGEATEGLSGIVDALDAGKPVHRV